MTQGTVVWIAMAIVVAAGIVGYFMFAASDRTIAAIRGSMKSRVHARIMAVGGMAAVTPDGLTRIVSEEGSAMDREIFRCREGVMIRFAILCCAGALVVFSLAGAVS